MRYNKYANNYEYYVEEIKREKELQKECYDKIKQIQEKMKPFQFQLSAKMVEMERLSIVDELIKLSKELDDIKKDIDKSKERVYKYEQNICNHDFGIVLSSQVNERNGRTYNSGICLECGKKINNVEGKIFRHCIVKTPEISNAMSLGKYMSKLEEYKDIYGYLESHYAPEVGDTIVNEIVKDAIAIKKSRCK